MHHNLYSYAERKHLVDPGFSNRPVNYQMVIDLRGTWLAGQPLTSGTEPYVILHAPVQAGRTSGIAVSIGVESLTAHSAFKVDAKATTPERVEQVNRRGRALRDAYHANVRRLAADTRDPHAEALATFVTDLAAGVYGTPAESAAKCIGWSGKKPLTGSEWVTVVVRDADGLVPIYERPAVRAWIRAHRPTSSGSTDGELVTCTVTGRRGPLARTQTQIKGLPGAKGGSSALSSYNKSAWCSFGLVQGANAPIIQDVDEGIAAAANYLLERVAVPFVRPDGTTGVHYKPRGGVYPNSSGKPQPGDPVLLLWTNDPRTEIPVRNAVTALITGPSLEATETLLRIEDAEEGAVRRLLALEADEKAVEEMLTVHRTGRVMPLFRADYFHALLISDNGRVVYRSALTGTIDDLRRRLQQYLDDLRLPIPTDHRPRSLAQLLAALRARPDERFSSGVVDGMLSCIFQGSRVPTELAAAALERCNTYPGNPDDRRQWRRLLPTRCSLLKLDLLRKGIPVPIFADPFKDQNLLAMPIPMVVGAILAEADYVQTIAIDDPQHSSLSRTEILQGPRHVLPSILALYTKHIKKLSSPGGRKYRPGMATLSQKRMDMLVTRLAVRGGLTETGETALSPMQIPQRFTREDQMLLWLGFHNLRGWLWQEYSAREAVRRAAKEVATAATVHDHDDAVGDEEVTD